MPNPLKKAHEAAQEDTNRLGVLFSLLGNSKNPDTPLLAAYRNANRALQGVTLTGANLKTTREITNQLKKTVSDEVLPVLKQATIDGANSARRQTSFYGGKTSKQPDFSDEIDAAYELTYLTLQEQEAALIALILGGADSGLIFGDEHRLGVLRPMDVVITATFWIAALFWRGFSEVAGNSSLGGSFGRQAIAAIDARTTDCCLRVHGQVVGMNEKFHLTGTPRYADYLDRPPFHSWCRTSTALYIPGFDDGLTELLEESAKQVLAERASGMLIDRHPADAFS